jgi:hypothetical protein
MVRRTATGPLRFLRMARRRFLLLLGPRLEA